MEKNKQLYFFYRIWRYYISKCYISCTVWQNSWAYLFINLKVDILKAL